MKNILLFAAVAALIIGVAVYLFVRSHKIRRDGVEADAVVSRIDERERVDGEGSLEVDYTYYVTFRTQDGRTVEAQLTHAPGRTRVGQQVRVKYLPEKPKYAVLIK